MKRDLELIVQLMREIEEIPADQQDRPLAFFEASPPAERPIRQYHLDLLIEAGFVSCRMRDRVRMGEELYLTWSGCEFLGAVRDDTLRRKTVKTVGSTALEVVRTLAIEAAVQAGRAAMDIVSRNIGASPGS